jgi:hypothetical protein
MSSGCLGSGRSRAVGLNIDRHRQDTKREPIREIIHALTACTTGSPLSITDRLLIAIFSAMDAIGCWPRSDRATSCKTARNLIQQK